jgi:2C-methyl-D-erythritol 2,4-cyclodiphosphate synthase
VNARVGIGYDSHCFAEPAEGRPLILGGVTIPHDRGLAGHSDADVLTHAVIDALLGACGQGDIGTHFPPDSEQWAGADSLDLLRRTLEILEGTPVNVEDSLSTALGAPVSVKATTNEGMGWIGRGEGLACTAVALVERQA